MKLTPLLIQWVWDGAKNLPSSYFCIPADSSTDGLRPNYKTQVYAMGIYFKTIF